MGVLKEVLRATRTVARKTVKRVERVVPDVHRMLVHWVNLPRQDAGSYLGGSLCYDPKARLKAWVVFTGTLSIHARTRAVAG